LAQGHNAQTFSCAVDYSDQVSDNLLVGFILGSRFLKPAESINKNGFYELITELNLVEMVGVEPTSINEWKPFPYKLSLIFCLRERGKSDKPTFPELD